MTDQKHKRVRQGLIGSLLFLLVLTALPGCGFWNWLTGGADTEISKLPQDLAQEGMDLLAASRYEAAVQSFQALIDRFPYSKYAILAELKIADAYYFDSRYIEAFDAYKRFEELHPKNEAVPYVIYQQGMCQYQQMNPQDRDQTNTALVIQTFARLQQTYPESKYAGMAVARLGEAQTRLAAHEFEIAKFYLKKKAYKAALGRFHSLIKNYPNTGYHAQALEYIKIIREEIAAREAAAHKTEETQNPGVVN